jgi:diguanylate cyclase (GGDEF)-like protein
MRADKNKDKGTSHLIMHVILLKNGKPTSATLLNALRHEGFSVRVDNIKNFSALSAANAAPPLALIYEIAEEDELQTLESATAAINAAYPQTALIACRHDDGDEAQTDLSSSKFSADALQNLGFHAVTDDISHLLKILCEIEKHKAARDNSKSYFSDQNYPSSDDASKPANAPHSLARASLALPKNLTAAQMRAVLKLVAALHFAPDQKSAAETALDGLNAILRADRLTLYLSSEATHAEAALEAIAARGTMCDAALDDWRRILSNGNCLAVKPSQAARRALKLIEAVRAVEDHRRILAIPLLAFSEAERQRGEKVLGVLEFVRENSDASLESSREASLSKSSLPKTAKQFSKAETMLAGALAAPVAAALANAARISEAERLSLTDDLTKLHNARFLRQFLINEIKRARRYNSSVAALFLDLDDFKRINDQHGHLVGSHILKEMAQVILSGVRDTDIVARYGGDEFVVILPETDAALATRVAERVRERIARNVFHGGRALRLHLTASFGVAAFPEHVQSPQQLLDCADTAMYEAKAARKNCVRAAETCGSVRLTEKIPRD